MEAKFLPCIFLDGVSCAYRKDANDFRVMARCASCTYYLRFLREMEEEDAKLMEEIDQIHKFGYPKSKGDFGL